MQLGQKALIALQHQGTSTGSKKKTQREYV